MSNKSIHVRWPAAAPAARPWPRSRVVVLCRSCIQTKGQFARTPRILSNSHSDLQKSQHIVNITSQSDLKLRKGSQKHSQRIPMGTKSDPRVPSRDPRGLQMSPKRSQSDPKGAKRCQKSSKRAPKCLQNRTQSAPQNL